MEIRGGLDTPLALLGRPGPASGACVASRTSGAAPDKNRRIFCVYERRFVGGREMVLE